MASSWRTEAPSRPGHYAADRAAAERAIEVFPEVVLSARANGAFLGRAVTFLARDAEIRQFLDIGTGIPAANNTHRVAQAIASESRVVYVDNDRYKSGCTHARKAMDDPLPPEKGRMILDSRRDHPA